MTVIGVVLAAITLEALLQTTVIAVAAALRDNADYDVYNHVTDDYIDTWVPSVVDGYLLVKLALISIAWVVYVTQTY